MKNKILIIPFLIVTMAIGTFALPPQSDADRENLISKLDALYSADELPERYANYRQEYKQSYDDAFEDVFNNVIEVLGDFSCRAVVSKQTMNDEGYFKGVIKSDYCVFANKIDGIVDSLEYYSVKVPFIRGGIWETGRIKYTFILREQEDGSTSIEIRGEVSGLENNITETIHFWESNGNFEVAFLDNLSGKLGE